MIKNINLCRVSSKEQEETGYSLEAQDKLLAAYSSDKKFETVKVFKIAESATRKQVRKQFNEMFTYATKNKINIICCEKIDRLTRNLKDASLVQDWVEANKEREVHFLKESFILNDQTKAHENLVWDMKVAIARFYSNNLSEEVKKGQKEKLSQGWLPTKPPLGYKTIGEKGHKTHIIEESKRKLIQTMFELYSTGNYSTTALVELMYQKGLRNRVNKKVGKSMLYNLLSDPFYCGKIRWKEEILPGKQEKIITKDLFDLVQGKLNRKFKSPLYTKHLTVFKAKMSCSDCGGTVTWEIQKGHCYGHCNHYRKCQQNIWWREERVENVLLPLFDKMAPKGKKTLEVIEKALKETHKDEIKNHTNTMIEINNALAVAQRRLEAIYEDKIDGKITPIFYAKKLAEYTKEKEEAQNTLIKLNEGNTKYYQAGYALHELAMKAGEIYRSPKATVEDKRLLLSKIFSNLSLGADIIRPDYTSAFQFLTKWVPILNNTFELSEYGLDKEKESNFMLSSPQIISKLRG